MACSYLNFSIQKIHQISKHNQQKMVAFVKNCLVKIIFEAVFVNLCCYEYGADASEAVQKISTRILLRVSHSGGNIITIFFETDAPPMDPSLPLKNEGPH